MFKTSIVLFAILGLALAGRVFRQCPDGSTFPSSMTVGTCDSAAATCDWTNGDTVHTEIVWTAAADITSLQAELIITINGVDNVYPINPDGCVGATPGCPIAAGTVVTHVTDTLVQSTALEMIHTLTASLRDQNGATVLCYQLDAIIHA